MKILFFTGRNPKNLSGVSWKVWKIEQKDRAVTVWWGPVEVIGRKVVPSSRLQSKTWRFQSEASAKEDADRRMTKNLTKGTKERPNDESIELLIG